jgi:hypothetical protein
MPVAAVARKARVSVQQEWHAWHFSKVGRNSMRDPTHKPVRNADYGYNHATMPIPSLATGCTATDGCSSSHSAM